MKAFKPNFRITNEMTSAITEIERARGFLEAAHLSKEWVQEMANRALVLEAHHTTHIEGTQLTLEQSERLLKGKNVPGANPDDKRELLNYRAAFEFVSTSMDHNDPITEGLIREIHKKLVEGVRGGQADPGQYRQTQNYIANTKTKEIIYTPPSPHDVSILMTELVQWLNSDSKIHPVLISGIAQFQLVHIHPFLDGNGRTSRLLSTLCLYKSGYDFKRLFTISEFYDRDRTAFYKAIQSVRENDMDMTSWLDYFIVGLKTQMIEVRDRGEQVICCDILAKKHGLNERQKKILDCLVQNNKVSIQNLEKLLPKVNRRTIQRDLRQMLEKKVIAQQGATNNLTYFIDNELEANLRQN